MKKKKIIITIVIVVLLAVAAGFIIAISNVKVENDLLPTNQEQPKELKEGEEQPRIIEEPRPFPIEKDK